MKHGFADFSDRGFEKKSKISNWQKTLFWALEYISCKQRLAHPSLDNDFQNYELTAQNNVINIGLVSSLLALVVKCL